VQTGDFDLAAEELARLRAGDARVGAVVSFVGTVRDMNEGASVAEMELEHYPGMTERALQKTSSNRRGRAGRCMARW
jgi:molybdopterin synthase catalytic subunit